MVVLGIYLLFSSLSVLTEANSALFPRMTFTAGETALSRLNLPAPVKLTAGGEPDIITAAGQRQLISFNFQNPQKTHETALSLEKCSDYTLPKNDCNYNITVVHKRTDKDLVFVCKTNDKDTLCCDMNVSEQSIECIPSEKMDSIKGSIREFTMKEGELSALVESGESADLYITYSGSHQYAGIHKFGKNRVGPSNQYKEQNYVGLVLSRRKDDHLQDKVYAFYNERNRDTSPYSEMWLPFVTQVCMADMGGSKQSLQFTWTSQMKAMLFCGDADSGQHFSELVDVAAVHAERWQDTRVYALFRNEWGISGVCVYTIGDIEQVFQTSPFKDGSNRPRMCVEASTKIALETLRKIEKTSEMEEWVQPVNNPLLFKHHSYTHIAVDSSQHLRENHHPVLFLSLNSGGIHKVTNNESHAFVIAEYRPFDERTHILSIVIQPSSRKLYVNSRSELVQLDVENCAHYGTTCKDCVLARDPYCGWNGTHCTPATRDTVQDVARGDYTICKSEDPLPGKVFRYSADNPTTKNVDSVRLHSKYFLRCPVTSHHAQYTWHYPGGSTSCSSREPQCLLLINSMDDKQVGEYTCVSEEMGHRKVLAQYQLQLLRGEAGHSASPLLWVLLTAVLILLC